jgi:hypothetical protein
MINRAALFLKYKLPAVEWINEADPYNSPRISLEEINQNVTVFLLDHYERQELLQWLKLNYRNLFQEVLFEWYVDESLWPKKLSYDLFNRWFDVEYHEIVRDTLGTPIFDDD